MSQVAIVIPNWNGSARLANLLERLQQQTYPIHRVTLVDNGSQDNSRDVARNAGASIIELRVNTGFTHAANCGIPASAGAGWIAIMNNEASPEPEWLAQLVSNAECANTRSATSKLPDDSADHPLAGSFNSTSP